MAIRRRKFWGWGYEDQGLTQDEVNALAEQMAARFKLGELKIAVPPRLEEIDLPAPRISIPGELETICTFDPHERAGHSYGKSFRDVLRAFRRDFRNPPDVVAFPANETDLIRLLEWCDAENLIAIPYGGGSTVTGGVEPPQQGSDRGVVSIDMMRFDRVLEVDRQSRAARIQGGVFGPSIEEQLRPHGLTLRHFPQSFESSTLGGWIATRSGGHYATLYTHIDDFVESLRVVTPSGVIETRRLPGSGAGPSPERLFIGSEGILGIITEAWMRLQDRPTFRAGASVLFADFSAGVEAVRVISQSGLYPANCRLLDSGESANVSAASGGESVLVLAFESADHPVDASIRRALECCADYGGRVGGEVGGADATHQGAAGAWRRAFLRGPYMRDAMVAIGILGETFETAITWNRFREFHGRVLQRVGDAIQRVCGQGMVTCRFTHVYPDGPAPYYSVLAPARPGAELEQWDAIKQVAMDTVIESGGTITHHHSVGRDHRPGYDRERPEGFALALRAAKRVLDPRGILNPGVLIDP
jgi:alkyldihydroxyacetonephosphate synthase